ncbi:HAMP domain-containing sensor histidine kinase [Janthinobacterium sp. SUN100]|uniref:sensor histidine kinase n=1 Tax=Janthinobacterium sp. SUN100 TaxID=3004101 RepID=UPI0025B13B6B|nr:HAMP domain-containing sensor histidine kinase [Janthinobacterium sp. SUN100]MDN2700374.1 HAMP domain-containing sensor histidine kinase [Janthinobacterium sp. SUN100]
MDHQTASIALSITQLCISATMIGVYFAAPTERYTRLWAMSGLLTAVGMTVIIFNAFRPPGLMLMVGNTLLFSGCIVVWVGLRAFLGKQRSRWAYFLVAVFACSYFVLIESKAEFSSRAIISSASLILVFVLCLQTLLARNPEASSGKLGYAREMAMVGLLMLITAHILRIVILLYKPADLSAALMSQINIVAVYLVPLAGTLLFFPALLLLYFERIKHQLLLSLESKQEALENQTRFVEMFSHEYRTPLAVIRTNLDILQNKERSSGRHFSSNLEKMQRAVLRLVEVAETALRRDQNSDGNTDILHEPILMPDFLRSVIEEASHFWSERAPRLEFTSSQPVVFHGDRKLLKTAFLNVLDNSIKYGPKHGLVSVQLRKNNGTLLLTVEDNGSGIPEHELDLVYGKYFRGSRTGFIAGSGIGLYLVRRIIGLHAGSILLVNRPEGGTSATITLPLPIKETQSGAIKN